MSLNPQLPSMEIGDFGLRLLSRMAEENKAEEVAVVENNQAENAEMSDTNIFSAPKCKTETVVIYLDRAEVCRSLKTKIKRGENEVVVKDLSSCIDKDSIRVEGRGPATISEVAFQCKQLTPDEKEENEGQFKEMREQLKEAEQRLEALTCKETRALTQRSLLDQLSSRVGSSTTKKEGDAAAADLVLNSDTLMGMAGFIDLYNDRTTSLDACLLDVRRDISRVKDEVAALRKNVNAVNAKDITKEERELSILLDGSEDAEVELFVSYVVTMARWSPKYDIRVFSNDKQLKILYYGMIQQATGEDWVDAKLSLSTAVPSVGGSVPDLGTQKLGFKRRTSLRFKSKGASFRMLKKSRTIDQDMTYAHEEKQMSRTDNLLLEDQSEAAPTMEMPVTEVKESMTTTTYEITRLTSIPCDNVGHKVSVAIIDLQPGFEYETAPRKSTHAFLKAKVKNTSPYALLAGPTNIFLDNNFITKAELKAVSPSEEFVCSLGADPGVKIDYKPVHKFKEQSGLLSKVVTTTYKQDMVIKNTHTDSIRILVVDQLPLSTEEKIKVSLQEPLIKHPEKYDPSKPIRLNKMNNIEWDLDLAASESKDLTLRYVVEHPATEEIDNSVTHYNPVTPITTDA